MRPVPALLALLIVAACGDFPLAGDPTGVDGYPGLLPLSQALEGVPENADEAAAVFAAEAETDAALQAQAAALQSRADALLATTP
ncbi:hypothetical protein ACRDNQ_01235 [Palleronia sp. KMU-117]|uniref:hypothetical protein n=1 Tax=Palleronia sp. KMU-117 TaxID=3434108 RepID=UPI003D7625ED